MADPTYEQNKFHGIDDATLATRYREAIETADQTRDELEERGWSIDNRSRPPKITRSQTKMEEL